MKSIKHSHLLYRPLGLVLALCMLTAPLAGCQGHTEELSLPDTVTQEMEVSAGGRDFPVLAEEDLRRIEITVLEALRKYDQKKKEEQMVP